MTNVNQFIFTRTAPKKKIEVVNGLSESELLAVNPDTITRIVKETGYSYKNRSQSKELRISRERRAGNDWNSEFEYVSIYKKKLYVGLYVQYGDCDTDTTQGEDYNTFFRRGNYEGQIKGVDYRGNTKYYYYTYGMSDKAKCVKSILLEYLYTKYKEKLQADGNS